MRTVATFFTILIGMVIGQASLAAQSAIPEANVVRIEETLTLDGKLDESFWKKGTPATGFWENFPSDSIQSPFQTEVWFAADESFFYIGAKCKAAGTDYVVPSLRRDYRAGGSDNITFVLDPFGTGRNALAFGINPLGINREALISNGGENPGADFSEAWDNKWKGEAYIGEGYWSCEMVIPLRSLRYPAGEKTWRFQAYRFDTQSDSRSTWIRIPQQQSITSLAYMGDLNWDTPPGNGGGAVTVIPFVAGSAERDFEDEPNGKTNFGTGIGGDAKISLSSSLNLDLTFNPDFSQVEVDRQVLNLTRFELSFPERRQFFLENSDLFGSFGFGRVNPFFSRRIGITQDTATGEAISNPIFYGARLNGQLNEKWRIGLLNMQADANKENGLPSYNYTVGALQRQIGARSNVGLIAVNKQNFTDFSDSSRANLDFNRLIGIDYNLATADNTWTGKAFMHAAINPSLDQDGLAPEPSSPLVNQSDANLSHGLQLVYRKRLYEISYDHAYVSDGYRAEVGFVPRTNIFTFSPEVNFRFFPSNGNIVRHGPTAESRYFFTSDLKEYTDQRSGLGYNIIFSNTARLNAELRYTYLKLTDEFDPTRTDATPLPSDTEYGYYNTRINFQSDRRKKFSYRTELTGGQFFNGTRYGISGSATYRFQPYGLLTLRTNYSYIDLPDPYATTGLFLIGPRLDLTFSKSLFLTTVAQYNDQFDNLNLNLRLQWRYAPVSDLFIVYTDNFDTIGRNSRNRAVIAKMTYWLNL